MKSLEQHNILEPVLGPFTSFRVTLKNKCQELKECQGSKIENASQGAKIAPWRKLCQVREPGLASSSWTRALCRFLP